MNELEAKKIVNLVETICEPEDIWHEIEYIKHPELRMIKISMSIKVAPKGTRKMEVKQ